MRGSLRCFFSREIIIRNVGTFVYFDMKNSFPCENAEKIIAGIEWKKRGGDEIILDLKQKIPTQFSSNPKTIRFISDVGIGIVYLGWEKEG